MSDMGESGYRINGLDWPFSDIALVVTTFDDIGGVIAGTFSGTIESIADSSTMTIENGQINVICAPDDSSPD